jgi:hypothetical protein
MWDLTVDAEEFLADGGGVIPGGALRPEMLVAFHY